MKKKSYAELCLENASFKKQKELNESVILKEANELEQEKINNIYELRNRKDKQRRILENYKLNLKKSLLFESIKYIYKASLNDSIYMENTDLIIDNMINNFIEENGENKLLSDFKKNSYLLSEVARIIEENYNIILEKAKKNEDDNMLTIEIDDKDKFFSDLNMLKMDVDEVSDSIKSRVSNSINTFMDANIKEKYEIKEIIDATAEKIDKENNENIKESYSFQAKQNINKIKAKRSKNIFECMVYNICESSIINDKMKKIYAENNNLNMDKIVETTEIIYTFFEMVNTCKMINTDTEFVKKIIK